MTPIPKATDTGRAVGDRYRSWYEQQKLDLRARATDTRRYWSCEEQQEPNQEPLPAPFPQDQGPTTTGATGAASIVDSPGGAIL